MKIIKLLFCFSLILLLSSCTSSSTIMTSEKMNNLELGMTKDQVVSILGKGYTIAEKRVDNGVNLEVLSYRNLYKDDEFYMFVFTNDKLERWYRDLLPKYETAK